MKRVSRMMKVGALALWAGVAAGAGWAKCAGNDLRGTLTVAERAELNALVAGTPYPQGNHWIATRGTRQLHIVGTMHLDDPRMADPLARLRPLVEAADHLLLEMTPSEEAELQQALVDRPGMLFLTGETLIDMLDKATWDRLVEAAVARGIPGFMAAKFQPWYLMTMLSIPPCAMALLVEGQGGLDKSLAAVAEAARVPMSALEPFDTGFKVFNREPIEAQIEMLVGGLMDDNVAADLFATLTGSYFDEDIAESWHGSRILSRRFAPDVAASDAMFDKMQATLLDPRNLAWIPVIEGVAGDLVMVAVGAAHLPGELGVLNLLVAEGYVLERVPF